MRTRYVVMLLLGVALLCTAALLRIDFRGFSTRSEPSTMERLVARAARRWAVPRRMRDTPNPVAFSPDVWTDARAHFADHCATCHANNGRGDTEIGRNLYPKAPDMRLADTQRLTDGELYWIIENGVRLTGMPAWGIGGDNDTDTWKLVYFVRHLNDLTAEQLQEMEALNPKSPSEVDEERQDQNFLEGKESESTSTAPSHHQAERPTRP
jgi:mono/diheme cytochrome c family protein